MPRSRRIVNPPDSSLPGDTPVEKPLEETHPIIVEITVRVDWANLADFQQAWESYKDRLREYAVVEKATLTIPPRAEAQIVDL